MKGHESTYHFMNVGTGVEAELARLRTQVLMSWEKEYRLLRLFGLKDGMSILEAGCGPGYYTKQLVEHLPNSSVTALDIDGFLLSQAKISLNDIPAQRLQWLQASVLATGLKDQLYDFVIVRLLFLHLFEPLKAAKELYRVLKPGGKLVIIDIDDGVFGAVHPEVESLPDILTKLAASQARNGGNRHIGRVLPRVLKEAGFIHIDMEAILQHSDIHGVDGFKQQFAPERFVGFLNKGVISQEEFEQIKELNDRLKDNSDTYAMMIFLMACGTKPSLNS